jgi:DNA-binding GntR family transcriptional regulator
MIESKAFRSLPGNAMWVMLRFTQKQTWNETKIGGRRQRVYENSGLTFTYTEAEYFDISASTFLRSIRVLVERGFIDAEHRGGTFGHGEIKDYSRYKLSNRWKAWGTDDFEKREFKRLKYKSMDVQARIKQKEIS